LEKGMVNDAITEYQKAIEADPLYALVRCNLGNIFLEKGRVDEAIAQYQKALQIDPAYANVQHWLGIAFGQKGREREAISHLQSALQIEPSNMQIQNDLAWHLATCPEASLRNGKKSLELARQANDLAGGGNPIILQILAAACAEVGQFNDAKRNVQKAIELAPATGRQDLLEQLNNELKFYEAGRSLNK
jgi:tetratricopeptide (TPR) repeat protein